MQLALSNLPDRQREAVVLRYLEQMDVSDTAELMGCAPGTVKASVHAGLSRLRAMLSVQEPRS
jgi:RNA polymerase sigma factor (sigma-70 family)